MVSTSNECQLQLAFQAFEKDLQLNICKAMRLYNVPRITLSIQINNVFIRVSIIVNLRKLTALKEEVVVREVFDIDSRGFPPRIYNIEDIANRLLATYNAIYIGLR